MVKKDFLNVATLKLTPPSNQKAIPKRTEAELVNIPEELSLSSTVIDPS